MSRWTMWIDVSASHVSRFMSLVEFLNSTLPYIVCKYDEDVWHMSLTNDCSCSNIEQQYEDLNNDLCDYYMHACLVHGVSNCDEVM